MNGIAFIVWSAVLFLALALFFYTFDTLMETIASASTNLTAQLFALFVSVLLLGAVAGWIEGAYDLFTGTAERVRSRRRWPN